MQTHEEGLIKQYISKIQSLGVKAENGEDVESQIDGVIDEACKHFLVVQTSDPEGNLKAFRGRLKITKDLVHASQTENKRALEYAFSNCPEHFSDT